MKLPLILLDMDAGALSKLIIGAIALVYWGISAAVAAAKKDAEKRAKSWERLAASTKPGAIPNAAAQQPPAIASNVQRAVGTAQPGARMEGPQKWDAVQRQREAMKLAAQQQRGAARQQRNQQRNQQGGQQRGSQQRGPQQGRQQPPARPQQVAALQALQQQALQQQAMQLQAMQQQALQQQATQRQAQQQQAMKQRPAQQRPPLRRTPAEAIASSAEAAPAPTQHMKRSLAAVPGSVHHDEIEASEIGAPKAVGTPAPNAASILRQLRPNAIRAQMVLMEILQPPLALRG